MTDQREKATAAREGVTGDGAAMIATERERQVAEEGWTPAHDDKHIRAELVAAAICYARTYTPYPGSSVAGNWPWEQRWWKPGSRIENLVKAGALIAAEIDRLKRRAGG